MNPNDSLLFELVHEALWDSELPQKHICTTEQAERTRQAKNWIMIVRRRAFHEAIIRAIQDFLGHPTERATTGNPMTSCIRQQVEALNDRLFYALKKQSISMAWTVYDPPMSDKWKSHLLVAEYLCTVWRRESDTFGRSP